MRIQPIKNRQETLKLKFYKQPTRKINDLIQNGCRIGIKMGAMGCEWSPIQAVKLCHQAAELVDQAILFLNRVEGRNRGDARLRTSF